MILLGDLKRCNECVPFKPEFSVIYSRYWTLYYLMYKCFQISNMLCVSTCKLRALALAISEHESQIFEKATPYFGGQAWELLTNHLVRVFVLKILPLLPLQSLPQEAVLSFSKFPAQTTPGYSQKSDISHAMSQTSVDVFLKQSQLIMPNYLLPKAFG